MLPTPNRERKRAGGPSQLSATGAFTAFDFPVLGPGAGAVPAASTYAGLDPTTVGLSQFNVVVPNVAPLASGFVAVNITVSAPLRLGGELILPVPAIAPLSAPSHPGSSAEPPPDSAVRPVASANL